MNNYFLLGIDYGTKKTGLAIGQSVTRNARPLKVLYNNYIKEQKTQQYFALFKISQHLDKLMEESYISKTKIEKLRFDKNKTLKEINIVRLELDQISENKI